MCRHEWRKIHRISTGTDVWQCSSCGVVSTRIPEEITREMQQHAEPRRGFRLYRVHWELEFEQPTMRHRDGGPILVGAKGQSWYTAGRRASCLCQRDNEGRPLLDLDTRHNCGLYGFYRVPDLDFEAILTTGHTLYAVAECLFWGATQYSGKGLRAECCEIQHVWLTHQKGYQRSGYVPSELDPLPVLHEGKVECGCRRSATESRIKLDPYKLIDQLEQRYQGQVEFEIGDPPNEISYMPLDIPELGNDLARAWVEEMRRKGHG